MFNNSIENRDNGRFYIRGLMVGCNRGSLYIHSWMTVSGTRVRGTDTENTCNGTSCSLADYSEPGYSRGLGKYVAVVHGVNRTTGNDAYVYVTLGSLLGRAAE